VVTNNIFWFVLFCNEGEAKGGRNSTTTCDNSITNVGGKNKVATSMSAFGLVAILLFVMF